MEIQRFSKSNLKRVEVPQAPVATLPTLSDLTAGKKLTLMEKVRAAGHAARAPAMRVRAAHASTNAACRHHGREACCTGGRRWAATRARRARARQLAALTMPAAPRRSRRARRRRVGAWRG